MSKIKLSICVPTHNREKTLELLLESIYRQIGEHKNEVEICISDNASKDNTELIVQNYFDKLNIHYYKHKKNLHPVINWDYAIDKMSHGEYVLMIGDDDIIINDGIDRMIKMINTFKSDYYYLNHIHAQIDSNYNKVYNDNCRVNYLENECECYNMDSCYVTKWEEILNYKGTDQEVNMLFIGNHLMRKGIWKIDVDKFQKMYDDNVGKNLNKETIEYYYSIWSPQVTIVAQNMMGKKCYYCSEPIISQGMGENTADIYQIMLILFLPRWVNLFKQLNMDKVEFKKYSQFILHRLIERYVRILLYKSTLLNEYSFCAEFIYQLGDINENIKMISDKLLDSKNDYYYNMINKVFEEKVLNILKNKNGKIVLWGTGNVAESFIESSELLRDNIDYVVDGSVKLHGKIYNKLDLLIHNPNDLRDERIYLVIIASLRYEDEIKKKLSELQCKEYYVLGNNGIEFFNK